MKDKKGIYEYILGGEQDTKLINIRVFDEVTKRAVYKKQTDKAIKSKVSNCPLCSTGQNRNKDRIYKYNEIEADHVEAWSKGGARTNQTVKCFVRLIIELKAIGSICSKGAKLTILISV